MLTPSFIFVKLENIKIPSGRFLKKGLNMKKTMLEKQPIILQIKINEYVNNKYAITKPFKSKESYKKKSFTD